MAGHLIIQCQGLTKRFGGDHVVKDVSLALGAGEILAVVGPSGSGKTTLLRLVAGFEVPDAGTVTLEDRLVTGEGTWIPPEERRLGMVFQDYALFPHMTVVQNVAFGIKGRSGPGRDRRAREMLEMVAMGHLADRYPYKLSGGEQQRVALARSMAPQPLALLLDEPFSNLDPHMRYRLRVEVKDILRTHAMTAVHVTHDQSEALAMGDLVAVMNAGRVEQVGTPEEVYHRPTTRFVAQFLGVADFIPARVTEEGLITEIGVLHPSVYLPPGTEAEVIVRVDGIAIRPSETGVARVKSRVFRGMFYVYTLSLPSGAVVHTLRHYSASYPEGTLMDVRLEPNMSLTCFVDRNSGPALETGRVFSANTGTTAEGDDWCAPEHHEGVTIRSPSDEP